ncbi:MAG: MBL fold metallo-hydrolase [Hyphomicrobiaceae bacterium]
MQSGPLRTLLDRVPDQMAQNAVMRAITCTLAAAILVCAATRVAAQTEPPQVAPDKCLALASAPQRTPLIREASLRNASLEDNELRLTFLGHATFLIESPKGVKAATDYAVPIPPPNIPDIVTMNVAHSSHYTNNPQPEITHVLRGWNPAGGYAAHDVTVEDMRVRNVPTNTRNWGGGTHEFGNSIFIFEVGTWCIAHLGHLHHPLTMQQLASIGQMDVVLVPVDGSWTLDYPGMLEVLKAMNPRLIVPMHYFTQFTLQRFLTAAGNEFPVTVMDVPTIVLAKDKLPVGTEILVLPGN